MSFFTKNVGRSVQLSSGFGKTFSYHRDACYYKDKVYQTDIYRKNNTCTSCVLMALSIAMTAACEDHSLLKSYNGGL